MGFLEYLKTFEITSTDAFSGWSGLMVVFCFLKDNTAKTRMAVPKKKNEILMILLKIWIFSENKGLEKYILNPQINATIGGGILLFIL